MLKILKDNQLFFIPYLIILILSIIIINIYNKTEIHIFINQNHNPLFDFFFKYITYLGNGLFVVLIFLICLFIKYRYALLIGISGILSSFVSQFLKQIIFTDYLRPVRYFNEIYDLHLVPGVCLHKINSFPSGHTISIFCVVLVLVVIIKNKYIKLILLILALIVGFSRIYLSQHFFIDVLAGSLIGVLITLICIYFMNNQKKTWFERSLLKRK